MNQAQKKIGIIGAGPSGLMAIKYAVQNGFIPQVFERNSNIGGVWNTKDGAVWKQMTTNLSKFTCSFMDFPWPQTSPIFPTSGQMIEYMQNYALKFDLLKYIQFNTEVISVKKVKDNQNSLYQLTLNKNNQIIQKQFKYLIVASGIFNTPYTPQIQGFNTFTGDYIHSKNYRDGQKYKNKRVLIIGGSFTGIQLASNISKYAQKVIHSYKKPFWIMPHFITLQENNFPIDFFFNRQFYLSQNKNNKYLQTNIKCSKILCKQQQQINQLKIDQQLFLQPIYLSVSSDYIKQYKQGKILSLKSEILKIQGNKVYLKKINIKSNKQQNQIDVQQIDSIIFCTGYTSGLSYLSQQIKNLIKFQQNNRLQPVILYKQMYHPQLDNLFFVGMYKGPYFAVMKLQAKAAINYFLGKANLPQRSQIQKGLQEQLLIRMKQSEKQFPHQEYVYFADQISKIAGNQIKIDELTNKLKKLKQQNNQENNHQIEQIQTFFKMSAFPCVRNAFTTNNMENQKEESLSIINSVKK